MALYHPSPPLLSGFLPEEDGHSVFWQTFGNENAPAIVLLHGGPGGGTRPQMVQLFDPELWHIVTIDQRGAGRSTPHAGDSVDALNANTTKHLIHDLERLRTRLGLANWCIYGASWGTTLAVAYALEHLERVNGLILAAVAMTSREDLDFLYFGARRFLPEAHEEFHALVPDARNGIEIAAGYNDLLVGEDAGLRSAAAFAWCKWEAAVVSLDPRVERNPSYEDARFRLGFARIVTHYFQNLAWLDVPLLEQAHKLAELKIQLIHSRLDLSAPFWTPWRLHKALPRSELVVVAGGLHGTLYGPLADAIIAAANKMQQSQ